MKTDLTQKKCMACEGAVKPLKSKDFQKYKSQIKGWEIIKEHYLLRKFKFKDFKTALNFVNKVAFLAEKEQHHPNICFTYGAVEIKIYTHAINGLFINDFILAAKINKLIN